MNPTVTNHSTSPSAEDRLARLGLELKEVDQQLCRAIVERANLSQAIAEMRRSLELAEYDPDGEERVVEEAGAFAASRPSLLTPETLRTLFRHIVQACVSLGSTVKIGYLGPPGTYSHMAARRAFGLGSHYLDFPNIPAVFAALEREQLTHAIVPIENSTEGGVSQTMDCLLSSPAQIQRELLLDVSLCLMGKESDYGKIDRVYSHPNPLGQCRQWLAERLPHAQLVAMPSTTIAAREASLDPASAAVASHLAAELNDLMILAESIQDVKDNVTRFVILAREDAKPTGNDKTTLVFSMPDERGSLLRALSVFHDCGLNLSRIESRPGREKLWEYVFFTDVEGHRNDPRVSQALDSLHEISQMVRVLGSYPRST